MIELLRHIWSGLLETLKSWRRFTYQGALAGAFLSWPSLYTIRDHLGLLLLLLRFLKSNRPFSGVDQMMNVVAIAILVCAKIKERIAYWHVTILFQNVWKA